MAQLLSELGFEVIYKQNASLAGMKSAIREFGNNIVRGDVALFHSFLPPDRLTVAEVARVIKSAWTDVKIDPLF
jgi:uncharacterized caspase-like protein